MKKIDVYKKHRVSVSDCGKYCMCGHCHYNYEGDYYKCHLFGRAILSHSEIETQSDSDKYGLDIGSHLIERCKECIESGKCK